MTTTTIIWTRPFNRSVQFEMHFNTYLVVVAILLGWFIVSNLSHSLNKLFKTYRHVYELTRGCSSHETRTMFTSFFSSSSGVGLLKWITLQLNFGILMLVLIHFIVIIFIIQMLLKILSNISINNSLYYLQA